jgi:cytochrome P450
MWALFALSQHPNIQQKLRDELLQLHTDTPTMDELNELPYLEKVVKETLRHHAPVPVTTRQAVQDDVIPVNQPFTDRRGKICDHIKCVTVA